jgi:hypothetical protein
MKAFTAVLCTAFLAIGSFSGLEAKTAAATATKPEKTKVEERLPEQLTAKIRKSHEYQGTGSKRRKVEVISASVKIPYAKLGRKGKGSVEMVVKELDKKKKVARTSNLKKGTRMHGNLKSFLTRAIEDYKKQS